MEQTTQTTEHKYIMSDFRIDRVKAFMADQNLFREMLSLSGIANPLSYEWIDGEAWYRGEPIQDRATQNEQQAINLFNIAKAHQEFPI